MSICIIPQFKIIQIYNCHTGRSFFFFQSFLIISSIIRACQCVNVKILVISVQFSNQFFTTLCVQKEFFIQFLHQFHYIYFSIYFHITGSYLINSLFHKLQFGSLVLFPEYSCRYTVLTLPVFLPECIAGHFVRINFFLPAIFHHLNRFFFDEPHHIKNPAILFHLLFHLLHRHGYLLLCHLLLPSNVTAVPLFSSAHPGSFCAAQLQVHKLPVSFPSDVHPADGASP